MEVGSRRSTGSRQSRASNMVMMPWGSAEWAAAQRGDVGSSMKAQHGQQRGRKDATPALGRHTQCYLRLLQCTPF